VCSKNEFDEWHKWKCLFGNCSRFGVDVLPLCPKEVTGSNFVLVQWRRFALETTMSKVSKALKKLTLVYKTTSSNEFVDYMKPKLQHFVRHNFVAMWENKHFKKCIKHFLANIVVSMVEFANNYSFEVQNEVQNMHWHTYQVSIIVHICFATTLHLIHLIQNTISIFLMIKIMIMSLFNIVLNCIGNMTMHHNGIGCGVMVVHHNLRITNHGILFQGIPI
jgi:hypothetical protein